MRKDLASSVFADRSLFDLGLDGGLGGFSVVMDISSADDASTLVLDDPALILPRVSCVGDLDVRFFLRLEFGLSVRSSSSSSLLEEFEVDRLLLLELDVADGLFVPQGDLDFLDLSHLAEPFELSLLPIIGSEPLGGVLSLDRSDFIEDPEETAWVATHSAVSESCELVL